MTRMTSARVVGVASLFYMAVGVANEVLTSRATSGQGTAAQLTRIALYATEMRITIILKLCECFAAVVLAVAFYGITREQDHELAILGLVCRAAEGVFVASLVPNAQALLWLAGAWPGVGAPDVATTNDLVRRRKSDLFLSSAAGTNDPRVARVVGRALLGSARHRPSLPARRLLHRPPDRVSVGAGDPVHTRARAVAAHQGRCHGR